MTFNFCGRRAGHAESLNGYRAFGDDVDFDVDFDAANVVTSVDGLDRTRHLPVLDIDFPLHVEPSTTPGHFHLYLDHPMPWADLCDLMDVMVRVGILEEGYVEAAKIRGYTSTRLPWVKKEARRKHIPTAGLYYGPDAKANGRWVPACSCGCITDADYGPTSHVDITDAIDEARLILQLREHGPSDPTPPNRPSPSHGGV